MKLNISDYVYYALNGICLVSDIQELNLGNGIKKYYVLTPVNNKSTFFLPIDNEEILTKVKKLLTKNEIDQLIIESKDIIIDWPKNSKERTLYFQNLLKKDDLKTTIAIIRTISDKQKAENKLSPNDIVNLSNATSLVNTSLAYSLNISKDDVKDYIIDLIK